MRPCEIWTIGHANHAASAFVDLLGKHGIEMLLDVRAHPRSRRHPQFGRERLESSLRTRGIDYVWCGRALGGFRAAAPDSRHTGLDASGFRGYADHMATAAFRTAAEELIESAHATRVALMCAEADPAHCHRQFIADYLLVRGIPVKHILGDGFERPHRLHECLRVVAAQLVYDRGSQQALL